MSKETISAKDVVSNFNIPYHTLNYYTAIGLLIPVDKAGNKRLYNKRDVGERLRKIARLAKEGYPLNLIRKKLLGA